MISVYICSLFVCHWLKACTGSLVGRDKYFSDIFKPPRDTKQSAEACLHVQDGTLHLRNGDIFISQEICSWYDLDIFQLVLNSGLAELHKACRSADQTRRDGAKVILVNYCCSCSVKNSCFVMSVSVHFESNGHIREELLGTL